MPTLIPKSKRMRMYLQKAVFDYPESPRNLESMSSETLTRLFDPSRAFDHPVTVVIVGSILAILAISLGLIHFLDSRRKLSKETYTELRQRWISWVFISVAIVVPILLGAATTIFFGLILSLLCYREYARATGLFREHLLSAVVVAGILLVHFAALDNYYRLFVAAWPISISFIVLASLFADRPDRYIQRLALAVLGFMMFGMWMGHFAFFANNTNYRAILLWLIICIELIDVFAYLFGRLFGKRTLCPNTSPNKTRAGAIGSAIVAIPLTATIGHFVFLGEAIDSLPILLTLGFVFTLAALIGDLMLSSIKRDLGIKDLANTLPGHGGLLDRFDSLLLALPAVFHLINYIQGINTGVEANILTGDFGNS